MNFVLDFIMKPAIILLFAAVLSLLLTRCSASVRHALWLLALTSAAVLPLVAMVVPPIKLPAPAAAEAIVTFLFADSASGTTDLTARPPQVTAYSPETQEAARSPWIQPSYLWGLIVALLSLRVILGTIAVRRLTKTLVPADASWNTLIAELRSLLSVRRPVRLLFSETQVSPMTWGVARHKILLPAVAVNWPAERRRLVLMHELAHVKRHDGLMQIVVQAICCVYWFNPLVWYAAHRIRIERERACDDHVLSLGIGAADYADHLLQIVRGLQSKPVLSYAAVSMAQPSQLETRLVSILDSRARRRTLSRLGTVSLSALTGLFTVSLAAVGIVAAVPLPPVVLAAMRFVPPPPAPEPAPAAEPAVSQRTRIGNAESIPGTAVVPPKVLSSRPPSYTQAAVENHIEGIVTLEASVSLEGKVTILRTVKGLGFGLDEKARQAVLQWKFGPATRNGVPVEAVTQIDVEFEIPVWFNPPVDDMSPIRMGAGVTAPSVLLRVEPEYTEEARKDKVRGKVVVQATVHQDGRLTVEDVIQELGHGLTGRAIEAIELWRFKPAMKDGKPVPVTLNIEVNFSLK